VDDQLAIETGNGVDVAIAVKPLLKTSVYSPISAIFVSVVRRGDVR
jgi:hypothetical protein